MKDSSLDVVGLLPALLRYARALVRNPADAEELAHDTLLRAYERRHTFDAGRSLRPWLFSILHNLYVDEYRRRQLEERAVEAILESGAASRPLPDADTRVQLAQVHEAFTRLPEAQRAALHLVAVEGLSYQEAADALSIPVGTLMSRLSRARAALRQMEQLPEHTAQAAADRPSGVPHQPVQLKLVKGSHGSE